MKENKINPTSENIKAFVAEIKRIVDLKFQTEMDEFKGVLICDDGTVHVEFEDFFQDLDWQTVDLNDYGKTDDELKKEFLDEQEKIRLKREAGNEKYRIMQEKNERKKYLELKKKYGDD